MKLPTPATSSSKGVRRPLRSVFLLLALLGMLSQSNHAFGSTWTGTINNNWNNAGNWTGGIPNGNGDIADFSNVDITGAITINQDIGGTGVDLGTMIFADASGANGTYIVTGSTINIKTGVNPGVINVVNSTDTVTISAALSDQASKGINKSGAGTWIQTANAHITGITTINGGVLSLSGAAATLTGTTRVTINSGGTLLLASTAVDQVVNTAPFTLAGGTLQLGTNNMSETVGALTLTGTSVIDFATLTGTNNMIFGASNAIAWTGGTFLNIYNWTQGTDHLFFGNVLNAGLTSGQLAQIRFYSDSGSTFLGTAQFGPGNGEVSPLSAIPEPSTIFAGFSLLSLVAYRERRWFFRCREARNAV